MEDRGAPRGYSRKRIRPAQSSVLRSASPVLDRAVSQPRVRQGERHESPNHHQRGVDPTRGTDQNEFRGRSGSPRHAAVRQSRRLSCCSLAPLSGKTDCFALQRCNARRREKRQRSAITTERRITLTWLKSLKLLN